MKAALLGAVCATVLLLEVWANLNPIRSRLGLPEVSLAAIYRKPSGIAENQHSAGDKSDAEHGTPPAPANPSTSPTGDNADNGKGLDWPAWIQAASAIATGVATIVLVSITGRQARLAGNQVELGKLQTAIYDRQASIMDGQLKATERAADAAASSVRVAEDTLTISQRSWITVDVRLVGPMTYTANDANFAFEYTMENIGNTPALRAFPQPILYDKTKRMPSEDIVLTNYIMSRGDPTEDPLGFTIGPKAKHVFTMRQHISRKSIEETRKSYKINGLATNILPVKFVGVVTYRSVVSKKQHETSFYYDIMKLNDDDPRFWSVSVCWTKRSGPRNLSWSKTYCSAHT